MNTLGIFQILLYLGVLVALVKPLGAYMARVYAGERTFLSPVLGPIERGVYGSPASTRTSRPIGSAMRPRCCW